MEITYTLSEVARDTGLPYQTIYHLIKARALEAHKHMEVWVVTADDYMDLREFIRLAGQCQRCAKKQSSYRWRFLGPYCADCGRAVASRARKKKQKDIAGSHVIARGEALAVREAVHSHREELALLALLQAAAVIQLSETPFLAMENLTRAANALGLSLSEIAIKERLYLSEVISVEFISVDNEETTDKDHG